MVDKMGVAVLLTSFFLMGCQYFMPVTADELPGRAASPADRGSGLFSGGICRYGNGEIGLPSEPGSSTC